MEETSIIGGENLGYPNSPSSSLPHLARPDGNYFVMLVIRACAFFGRFPPLSSNKLLITMYGQIFNFLFQYVRASKISVNIPACLPLAPSLLLLINKNI